jgi:hypothetical protein
VAIGLDIAASQFTGFGSNRFSGELRLNAASSTAVCRLQAEAFDAIQPQDLAVSFPAVVRLGEIAVSDRLDVVLAPEVTNIEVSVDPDFGQIVDARNEDVDGARLSSFQVHLYPVRSIGVLRGSVRMVATVNDADPVRTEIPVVARVESDVTFSPQSLIVVTSRESQSVSDSSELRVWSKSKQPIQDVTVSTNGLPLSVTRDDSEDGSQVSFRFELLEDAEDGTHFGTVLLKGVSAADGSSFSLSVPVTARSVEAQFSDPIGSTPSGASESDGTGIGSHSDSANSAPGIEVKQPSSE